VQNAKLDLSSRVRKPLGEIRAVQAEREREAGFYLVHHVVLVGGRCKKKLLLPGLRAGVLCSRWSAEQKQKHAREVKMDSSWGEVQ